MKFTSKENVLSLSLFPCIIPRKCCICKQTIFLERIYEEIVGPYYNGLGKVKTVCTDCAKTGEQAYDILVKIPPRPNLIPPGCNPQKR